MESMELTTSKNAPLAMDAHSFAEAGHKLVDKIAAFLNDLPDKPVTRGEQPSQIRRLLGENSLPVNGLPADTLLNEASDLLFEHSLFNGHPSFMGYITSSATPIGALADMLASAVNPNTGAYILSPVATEIERQTIKWLGEMIGFPGNGGIFVSGGNMANFIGFLAARKAKADWNVRKEGLKSVNAFHSHLLVYCAKGTHTWIEKAADLFGLGTDAIRWIDVNEYQQMDTAKLDYQITKDRAYGYSPFLVVGTAGSVGTGAVDPLEEISIIAKHHNCWFHVDGAYGAPAALLPENEKLFRGLSEADSVAIDPHKWLYSPLEAGCILVKNETHLTDAFSFHPEYFNFDGSAEDPVVNFYDYGLQNSRGFRALKVWLAIRQAGRNGYRKMIRKDIDLAQSLFELAGSEEELEAVSCNLSITTFRFVPKNLRVDLMEDESYMNTLNEKLLNVLQADGRVFLSNAVIDNKYCLRACIVNFRTTFDHLMELVQVVLTEGRRIDALLRGQVKDKR